MHDPRIGRFFAIDPLAPKYPYNSPYAFSENMVVHAVELEGLEATVLSNGETVYGPYTNEYLAEFNNRVEEVQNNKAGININEFYNFESYRNGESIVGNYVAYYIQKLPLLPKSYKYPTGNGRAGVKNTYDLAIQYGNCKGNCYTTTIARINKGYEDLYGITPIDMSTSPDGAYRSDDYITASTQKGAKNLGYGVAGALATDGEANLIDFNGVINGELKPGSPIQSWDTGDINRVTKAGGHSQIFLYYIYDNNGIPKSLVVFDNSGSLEKISIKDLKEFYKEMLILSGNLLDPEP